MNLILTIKIPVYTTESRNKVEKCITNLLGYLPEIEEIETKEYTMLKSKDAKIESLLKLFNHIRHVKILDAVRKCAVIDNMNNDLIFNLHKQALYVNRISVITSDTSSPLGNLQIIINSKNPVRVLDWLAPRTEKGFELKKTHFGEIFKTEDQTSISKPS
ncbi:MAG: RNA-binding domain-containing protein [Candidatus Heimdallarchaeaceae archaeon]